MVQSRPRYFAYHGYPWLIHRLTYRRTNHKNLHVRGYKEEGTTTTPFDMAVRNDIDRFHLAGDVIDRVPSLGYVAAYAKLGYKDCLSAYSVEELRICLGDSDAVSDLERGLRVRGHFIVLIRQDWSDRTVRDAVLRAALSRT